MPSKRDTTDETANVDFVEELVAAIDHNLRLKSRQHSSLCKQKRVSPYVLPDSRNKVNSEDDRPPETCKHCSKTYSSSQSLKHKTGGCCASTVEDPYEMLQDLLREGSLIKEAVKRLQLGLDHPKSPKIHPYERDAELECHNAKLYAV